MHKSREELLIATVKMAMALGDKAAAMDAIAAYRQDNKER